MFVLFSIWICESLGIYYVSQLINYQFSLCKDNRLTFNFELNLMVKAESFKKFSCREQMFVYRKIKN